MKAQQLRRLGHYNTSETMLFDRFHNSPFSEHIYPLFASDGNPAMSYDGPEIHEIRTLPLPLSKHAEVVGAAYAKLDKGVQDFGLQLSDGPVYHSSTGLDEKKLSLSDPAQRGLYARITESYARAHNDARMLVLGEGRAASEVKNIGVGVSRGQDSLRLADNRIELRPKSAGNAYHDPCFAALIGAASFLHAATHPETPDDQLPARWASKPNFVGGGKEMKIIRHALNGCTMDKEGKLLPSTYIRKNASKIAYQLGLIDIMPSRRVFTDPDYVDDLVNYFRQTRVVPKGSGYEVIFPEWNDIVERLSKRHNNFNVAKLRSLITVKDVVDVPLVSPGYKINSSISTPAEQAHAMLHSRLLNETLSPEYMQALKKAVTECYGAEPEGLAEKLQQQESRIQAQKHLHLDRNEAVRASSLSYS